MSSANQTVDGQFDPEVVGAVEPVPNTLKEKKVMKNMFIKASKKVVSGTKTVATAVGTKIIPTMGNVAHKSEELVEGAVKFSAKVSGKVLGHVIKDVKSVGHAFKDGYTSAIQTQQVSDLHAEGYQSANSVKDEQIK